MCGWWGGTARCAAATLAAPVSCWHHSVLCARCCCPCCHVALVARFACALLFVVAQRCLCLHLLVPVLVLAALSPPPCHMPPALIAALLLRVQVRWLAQGIPTKSELEDMSSLTKDLLDEGSKRGQKSEGGGKAGGGRRRRRG